MHRLKLRLVALQVPSWVALAALVIACSGSVEQQVLQKYFQAARLRDATTLGNIATAWLDPSKEGVVQSFDVASVGEERRTQVPIRELAKAYDEARAADQAFSRKKKEFQDANIEAIDRVLKAEMKRQTLRGKDADMQAAWAKWRSETAEYATKASDARSALSAARGIAELSVYNAQSPVDITQFSGEVISKDITISARVRTPEGTTVDRSFVVTMQRADLKGDDGRELSGRWMITGIKEMGAARTPAP
jgi:hypothetical protein